MHRLCCEPNLEVLRKVLTKLIKNRLAIIGDVLGGWLYRLMTYNEIRTLIEKTFSINIWKIFTSFDNHNIDKSLK